MSAVCLLALTAAALSPFAAEGDDAKDKGVTQQKKTFEREVKVTVKMDYLLYLPKGYEEDKGKSWPLILFLHGAGESGEDLEKVRKHGPPKLADTKEFPFIIVSPQSRGRGWQPEALTALLDDVTEHYRVDKDRVYLTGLSMGGFGTWHLAAAHPERFAAIAPICGGGEVMQAAKLKDLPIWAFHGAKDPTVPVSRSKDMVDAIKKAGGNPKLTIYPDAGHDSWTETYNNPELYEWFLAHKRGGPKD